MPENPQLIRYKKLLAYIEDHLHEELQIEQIEEVCHYSYRNINRIFEAINQETIGRYVKRLRLEKAAQYLKYSEAGVAQIAYQVGFEDRSAFSKAFKKRYGRSPQSYRESVVTERESLKKHFLKQENDERPQLKFETEYLPDFDYLFNEYRGDHRDIEAISKKWDQLLSYTDEKGLASNQSIFFTEIIDDAEISDHIHSRYNQAMILERPLAFEPTNLFRVKSHKRQKYAKFIHEGSQQSAAVYYQQIYAFWILDVSLELADLPIIEFYPNFEENLPEEELITEIYIPVS